MTVTVTMTMTVILCNDAILAISQQLDSMADEVIQGMYNCMSFCCTEGSILMRSQHPLAQAFRDCLPFVQALQLFEGFDAQLLLCVCSCSESLVGGHLGLEDASSNFTLVYLIELSIATEVFDQV